MHSKKPEYQNMSSDLNLHCAPKGYIWRGKRALCLVRVHVFVVHAQGLLMPMGMCIHRWMDGWMDGHHKFPCNALNNNGR